MHILPTPCPHHNFPLTPPAPPPRPLGPHLSKEGCVTFQAHTVLQGGHAALSSSGSNSSSRMSCQWTHPAKLACTAGRNLVQCQLGGRGRPGRVVLLHSRPEGDPFLGLAIPSQVHHSQFFIEFVVDRTQHIFISICVRAKGGWQVEINR